MGIAWLKAPHASLVGLLEVDGIMQQHAEGDVLRQRCIVIKQQLGHLLQAVAAHFLCRYDPGDLQQRQVSSCCSVCKALHVCGLVAATWEHQGDRAPRQREPPTTLHTYIRSIRCLQGQQAAAAGQAVLDVSLLQLAN
eukprot:GHRQ01013614.1.p2 GENE.GHRQ01013614.1~~GHRQ01013614.1.p2  ORF type:complete len:138 (-),score=30.84 GHRQ01013614.1:1001-1414(-)